MELLSNSLSKPLSGLGGKDAAREIKKKIRGHLNITNMTKEKKISFKYRTVHCNKILINAAGRKSWCMTIQRKFDTSQNMFI